MSADERARAAAFRFEKDSRRYILRRYILRTLLAAYTGAGPETIVFTYGVHGKPGLAQSTIDIRFNQSHAGDLVLYALASGAEVGIDVDCARAALEVPGSDALFFSPKELALLEALPPAARRQARLTAWVCNETMGTATGEGAAGPLHELELFQTEDGELRVSKGGQAPTLYNCLLLKVFQPWAGFSAALAVGEGTRRKRVRAFAYSNSMFSLAMVAG